MRLRKGDDNVLELLPWQQWFAIYLKCLLLNILFLVKNALKSIKCYLDRRYGPSRQYYVNKLKILNFNNGNSDNIKVDQLQHLASPPQLLMDTQLGKHSYIKLQVNKIRLQKSVNKTEKVLRLCILWNSRNHEFTLSFHQSSMNHQ